MPAAPSTAIAPVAIVAISPLAPAGRRSPLSGRSIGGLATWGGSAFG